jgi:2-isopropylmalate synthase
MINNTNKVRIFDTTLRDGEQSPGVSINPEQKLQIAFKLDQLGVDAIEAGFPIVSQGEIQAVRNIKKSGLKAEICGLARTLDSDRDSVIKCDLDYVHTFIATSDIHMRYKLKMTPEEVIQKAVKAVEYAKSNGLKVEFSAEDATRSD